MKAFIFDFDGVIVDSQRHWDSFTLTHIRSFIPSWTEADNQRQRGLSNVDTHAMLVQEYGLTHSLEEFMTTLNAHIENLYDNVRLFDGVDALLKRLSSMNIPVGLATASRAQWVLPVLERHGIHHHFQAASTMDDVMKSKPDPEVYLRTARELKVDPRLCVALEDSTFGIRSAKSAGMTVIGLRHAYATEDLSLADRIIDHPDELTTEILKML
ncbi:MAG TPA: HAD-IA family hydrolase [Candidatus Peribacteraceae bacterium]|nr:HAD-IA family hydrolase [Candidatus Peribacteraceae bacterium]